MEKIKIESEMYEIILRVYEDNGIISQRDFKQLSSRSYAEKLHDTLIENGHEEAMIDEAEVGGYMDYSNVIYNPEKYSRTEAIEYMKKYVLDSNFI